MKKKLLSIALGIVIALPLVPKIQTLAAQGEQKVAIEGTTDEYFTIHQPPANFNPLKATDSELKYYGYPARPTDSSQLNDWEQLVSGKWVMPKFTKTKDKPHTISNKKADSNLENSINATSKYTDNWSGYVYQSTAYGVRGCWEVPSISSDYKQGTVSDWVGLGGTTSTTPLVQMGTQEREINGTVTNTVWTEIVGGGYYTDLPQNVSGITINPGDQVYAYVYLSDFPSSGCTVTFYFSNRTRGQNTSFFSKTFPNYADVATSAEWISERPDYGTSGIPSYDYYPVTKDTAGSKQVDFWASQYCTTFGGSTYTTLADTSSVYKYYTPTCSPTALSSNGTFYAKWISYY